MFCVTDEFYNRFVLKETVLSEFRSRNGIRYELSSSRVNFILQMVLHPPAPSCALPFCAVLSSTFLTWSGYSRHVMNGSRVYTYIMCTSPVQVPFSYFRIFLRSSHGRSIHLLSHWLRGGGREFRSTPEFLRPEFFFVWLPWFPTKVGQKSYSFSPRVLSQGPDFLSTDLALVAGSLQWTK